MDYEGRSLKAAQANLKNGEPDAEHELARAQRAAKAFDQAWQDSYDQVKQGEFNTDLHGK